MKNLRIGTRILLGFALVVGLTVAMGLYALAMHSRAQKFNDEIDSRDARLLETLGQIAGSESRMRVLREHAVLTHLLRSRGLPAPDPAIYQREWVQSRDRNIRLFDELATAAGTYEDTAMTQDRRDQWRNTQRAAKEAQAALRSLVDEAELQFTFMRQDLPEMVARMPGLERLRSVFEARLAEAQRLGRRQVELGQAQIADYYDQTRKSIIAALIVAALLGLLLSFLIQRSITVPLRAFMGFVERVGQGDLTGEAPSERRRDELGDLARGLNRMVTGLKDVAGQARRMAEDLGAATAEILASTQQQAAGTAEQAAAVQQANATMTEITQAGSQISERARQVAASAEATTGASTTGIQAVQMTAANMESIREQAEAVANNVVALSEKTQAIGEIISTVNDIAEQSHLLALNAAIEAAAAGEHGRRFSVVASEMKNLAEESKQATVQVRSILGDIQKAISSSVMLTEEAVKRVESGRQQAGAADRAIRSLTGNIEESVRAFQQIVAGSAQQQIGFEQVSQAFRSISVAAQETAGSTRQSEKAAANLNSLAQQLRAVVERYRI